MPAPTNSARAARAGNTGARLCLGLVVLAGALLALPACRRSPAPSLVLVTIAGWPAEPTRELPATPRLDAWSRGALRRQLRVASTDLLPSEASLQTGLPPSRHGLLGALPGESLDPGARSLGEAARALGLATAAVASAAELGAAGELDSGPYGLARGFDRRRGPGARGLSPAEAVRAAGELLEELGRAPRFYLWLELDARDDQGGAGRLGEVDQALGTLLDELTRRGLDARTVVAVAGSLGEPRQAALLGPAATRVPYVLRAPSASPTLPRCPDGAAAVSADAASVLGIDGFACGEVVSETWAPARRFGLDPLEQRGGEAQALASAQPGARSVAAATPELVAALAQAGLPAPLSRWELRREGGGSPLAQPEAVLDQELASLRARAGHGDSAGALYERALARDPLALEAAVELARLGAMRGPSVTAAASLRALLPAYRGRPDAYHALGHTTFLLGQHEVALACSQAAQLFTPDDADLAFDVAVNLAALGRREEALAALDRAATLGFHEAALLDLPHFTALRPEPRFQALLARLRGGA